MSECRSCGTELLRPESERVGLCAECRWYARDKWLREREAAEAKKRKK